MRSNIVLLIGLSFYLTLTACSGRGPDVIEKYTINQPEIQTEGITLKWLDSFVGVDIDVLGINEKTLPNIANTLERSHAINSDTRRHYGEWIPGIASEGFTPDITRELLSKILTVLHIGNVDSGDFAGSRMYIIQIDQYGNAPYYVRILRTSDGALYALNQMDIVLRHALRIEYFDHRIANLFPMNEIVPKNANLSLQRVADSFIDGLEYPNLATLSPPKNADRNTIYHAEGCFTAFNSDGTKSYYTYNLPEADRSHSPADVVLDFMWNDGRRNIEVYDILTNQCGGKGYCYHTTRINPEKDQWDSSEKRFSVVGTMENGEHVYQESLSAHQLSLSLDLIEEFAGYTGKMYANLFEDYFIDYRPVDLSFADFYSTQPLLFIREPMGHYIMLRKPEYLRSAPCDY